MERESLGVRFVSGGVFDIFEVVWREVDGFWGGELKGRGLFTCCAVNGLVLGSESDNSIWRFKGIVA